MGKPADIAGGVDELVQIILSHDPLVVWPALQHVARQTGWPWVSP